VVLLLRRSVVLGFENEYGFRQYSKKQCIAPEKKIRLSVLEAEVFCDLQTSYLLHSGNAEYPTSRLPQFLLGRIIFITVDYMPVQP